MRVGCLAGSEHLLQLLTFRIIEFYNVFFFGIVVGHLVKGLLTRLMQLQRAFAISMRRSTR